MFKTTKAKVISVSIVSLICIIVTTILIIYQNIEIEEKEDTQGNEKLVLEENEKDVPGIDLKGTYNQNDLNIEERSVSQKDVEIRYYQISGLKNKNIEDKINKEIEHIALNWYKEEIKDLDEVINVYVNMWNSANFANTVSFTITYVAKIDDNGDGVYQGEKGLNFDLNTGNKITLEKAFTSDAKIENILRNSVYYSLITYRVEDNLAGDLVVSDYGDIEDEILEIINLYKKGKITEFWYTPRYINIVYNQGKIISIDMEKFAEYIALYSRYLSEDTLYLSDNIGTKNIYTVSNRYKNAFYYENYQNQDNYFIEISINYLSTDKDEFAKNIAQEKIDAIEKEIERVKQKATENKNKFYILNYTFSIYTGEEWSTQQVLTTCLENGNTYEMSVHDFEKNIEPIIIEYNRLEGSGGIPDYIYNFGDKLGIEPQSTIEYYNPETKEKIVI